MSWNVSFSNTSATQQVFTWNISFSNSTTQQWQQVGTWNFSFSNTTNQQQTFTWNISFSNTSIRYWNQINIWNVSFSNTTQQEQIVTWNVSFSNTSTTTQVTTWNVSFSNSSVEAWTQAYMWNISFCNRSEPLQTFTWNISFSNSSYDITIIAIYPVNESTISTAQPTLRFSLEHPDGEIMNYTIYTGDSQVNATAYLTSGSLVTDGSYTYVNYYNATETGEDFYWRIVANSSSITSSEVFYFGLSEGGGGGRGVQNVGFIAAMMLLGAGFSIMILLFLSVRRPKEKNKRNDEYYQYRREDEYEQNFRY
jgi:hypothetical protein